MNLLVIQTLQKYIRPFVIGVGKNLGVKPADEYIFAVFVSPEQKVRDNSAERRTRIEV